MRVLLRFFTLSLLALCLGFSYRAQASHVQGGDLTYTSLGGNQYQVVLHLYRDCSGVTLPISMSLNVKDGCNGTTQGTYPMNPVPNAIITGNQYCATATGICDPTGPDNFERNTYTTAPITIAPGQWLLSTELCCRPNTANLVGNANFRYEAALNNQVTVGGTAQTIANNSPLSPSNPAFFIPWKQASLLGNIAFDADGDSLVYSLDQGLDGCSIYVPYQAYPTSGPVQLGPNCYLAPSAAMPSAFTATNPVIVSGDTTGSCPLRNLVPNPNSFAFDATTGTLLVEPGRYIPNSASAQGLNKYVVVVKITEYRKIGGNYVVVGTTRRDLFLTVYDCGTNQMPTLTRTVGIQTGTTQVQQPLATAIPVMAGEPISVNLTATDRNPGQTITLSLMHNNVPGVTLQSTGAGAARLNFTPPLSLANGLYRVPVTVEDDACPLKGNETQLVTFRVHRTLATRAATTTTIAAYPTPFTSDVQFQLAKPGVQQLGVYDQLGRLVTTLRSQANGSVRWQPGTEVPAGLYFARSADGGQLIRLLRSDAK